MEVDVDVDLPLGREAYLAVHPREGLSYGLRRQTANE